MATWIRNTSRRTRVVGLVGIALALFILFEIGIRFIPPNGMTYTQTVTSSNQLIYQVSPTDPKVVAYWYDYTNNSQQLKGFDLPCNGMPPNEILNTGTFTFTFFGVPIESFSGSGIDVCPNYRQSAGGLPDILNLNYIPDTPGTYTDPFGNK